MKKEKHKKGLELLEEQLDPSSDRYRICPNPPCRKPHMVKNKGRDYCSDKCSDQHYNFDRKYRNLHEAIERDLVKIDKSPFEAEKHKVIDPSLDVEWLNIHNKNIELFRSLGVDPTNGTEIQLDYLFNLGINFSGYTAIGEYYNIDKSYASRYLVFGCYKLYLIDYNVVLVTYNDLQNLTT